MQEKIWKIQASYTVEASYIMSMVILSLAVLIRAAYGQYLDKTSLFLMNYAVDGAVAAVRNTGIFFINDVKARVHLCIFPADGKTFVGTSIVDYQDLHIFKGLLHGAGQTAAKIFFSIINRNDQ